MHYKKLLAAIVGCREHMLMVEDMIREGADLKECVDKAFALVRCSATVSNFDSQERDS
jgi:hypothetical protein